MPDSGLKMPTSQTDAATRHVDLKPSKLDTVRSSVEWHTPELSSTDASTRQFSIDICANEAGDTHRMLLVESECAAESSKSPYLTLIGPVGTTSPILELCSPSFGEFSRDFNERFLMDYFCNKLSHLIVLREDQGNPFQQLVLPLAYKSQAVKDAIYALASAHLLGKGINRFEKDENSIRFHNEAIRNLAKLIARGHDVDRNELLATIMLIVYFEVVSCILPFYRVSLTMKLSH